MSLSDKAIVAKRARGAAKRKLANIERQVTVSRKLVANAIKEEENIDFRKRELAGQERALARAKAEMVEAEAEATQVAREYQVYLAERAKQDEVRTAKALAGKKRRSKARELASARMAVKAIKERINDACANGDFATFLKLSVELNAAEAHFASM